MRAVIQRVKESSVTVDGQIIALEPTGGYEWALWEALDTAGYDVRQVSAAHVRAFSRATGALAKTDPIDARLIADFIAFRPNSGRKLPAKKLRYTAATLESEIYRA